MPLDTGTRLGPYEILSAIGAGGMGEVYRARDPRLGRDVAIKVLSGVGGATDRDGTGAPLSAQVAQSRVRRFEREARAVAALSHPNVMAIFDIGTGETPFLVTELLEGETLRSIIQRGPLPLTQTLDLTLQLAAGLDAAHARRIVHGDLKPENVFVTAEGRLKILDFGLAREVAPGAPGDDMTREPTMQGQIGGTLGYMAPEQLRGLTGDHRADIFAAGAILYEMVTGRRAFHGPSPADTISAVLTSDPSALGLPASTPPALARVIERCLDKAPDARCQSARELATAIEAISDLRPTPVMPPSTAPNPPSSIAVLPFTNLSAVPDGEYFSDGLAEDLINALTRLSGLRVASRTSSFRFRGRELDVRQMGRELGVGAILEGSVRRAGPRLRITVQLTSAEDGYLIWSERYDRMMADVFDIQDDIVAAILAALVPALSLETRSGARRPTENLEAYELYLKGRHFWNQRSPAAMPTAIRCFEQAIAVDPDYALAYTGLADCYSILRVYGWTPPEHSQPRALDAVTRALSIDPSLPEARFSKALYTFFFERHWRRARADFVDAIAASPRIATFEAYFGMFLAAEYEYAEARRHIERALDLDTHSGLVHFLAAAAACVMGDFAGAERHSARALELQPESLAARWPQTVALVSLGRFEEAIAVGETVAARSRAPIYLGVIAMVYASAGRLADARRLVQELDERQERGEYVVPAARLSAHLGRGDLDGIRASLAACADGGAAPFSVIATRALLDRYRSDAEIDRLLDRLHDGARPAAVEGER